MYQKGLNKNRLSLKEQLEQQNSAEKRALQADVQRWKKQYGPKSGSTDISKTYNTYKIAPFDAREDIQELQDNNRSKLKVQSEL